MVLLESLYAPTIKDRRGGLNQRRWLTNGTTTAAATANTVQDAVVPGDTTRIVYGAAVSNLPGAAQTAVSVQVSLRRAGASVIALRSIPSIAVAAAAQWDYAWLDLGWILLPGDNILWAASYSAGANPNTITGYAWGYDVPRGNVEG